MWTQLFISAAASACLNTPGVDCENLAWPDACTRSDQAAYLDGKCDETCVSRGFYASSQCGGGSGNGSNTTATTAAPGGGGGACVDTPGVDCENLAWLDACTRSDQADYLDGKCDETCVSRGSYDSSQCGGGSGNSTSTSSTLSTSATTSTGYEEPTILPRLRAFLDFHDFQRGGGGGGTGDVGQNVNGIVIDTGITLPLRGGKYDCDHDGVNRLLAKLPDKVPARQPCENTNICKWLNPEAEGSMQLLKKWAQEIDYNWDCSAYQAVPNGDSMKCSINDYTPKSSYCCGKVIYDSVYKDISLDHRSLGACVPDSVNANSPDLAENTVRVKSIIDSLYDWIPESALKNMPYPCPEQCTAGQDAQGWESIFPVHSFGGNMIDGSGTEVYSYDNFLRAVETFPAYCGKKDEDDDETANIQCRRLLATTFSHFIQETGANAVAGGDIESNQYTGLWYNAEFAYKDSETNLFAYTASTNHVYLSSASFSQWTPEVPGRVYPGRGAKQLTYSYNYAPASEALFGTKHVLLEEPDLALVGHMPFSTAIWFALKESPPKPSMVQVTRGETNTDQFRFQATTVIINGGVECGNPNVPAVQADRRLTYFRELGKLLGIENDEYYTNSMDGTNACCMIDGQSCITAGDSKTYCFASDWASGCQYVTWETPFPVDSPDGTAYRACLKEEGFISE